ncbi:MAG: YccF domain-containing protein [Paludibacteraceae bacterium]|nr:YccF domain-containing protein [Paludibacteraceae bacterium]MBQ9751581.1 YccF domain-containing protein [Paludibacteraceae bacterium]MBR1996027.1 YccF domain-containing protein [Paludibacteraceae bacterium]
MKFLGNLVWLIMGGLLTAVMYWFAGLLMCITIIGIPFGVQLFKIGMLSLWPFGHELMPKSNDGGCMQLVFNILWIVLGWWEIALTHLTFGLILCCTIVGIPWGMQHFKLALASLIPFGKEVV